MDSQTILTILAVLAILTFVGFIRYPGKINASFSIGKFLKFGFTGEESANNGEQEQTGVDIGGETQVQAGEIIGRDKVETTHIYQETGDKEELRKLREAIEKLSAETSKDARSPLNFPPELEEAAEYFKCRLLIEKKLAAIALSHIGPAMGQPEWDVFNVVKILGGDGTISAALAEAIYELYGYTEAGIHGQPPGTSPHAPPGMPFGESPEENVALVKELTAHIVDRLDMVELGPIR